MRAVLQIKDNQMKNITIKQSENVIALIRRHYVITILLPVLFVFNLTTRDVLHVGNQHSIFAEILNHLNWGIMLLCVVFFLIFLFQKKWKASFVVLLTPVATTAFIFILLNKYGIDRDTIYYQFNKNNYLTIIENSASVAQDGKAKLVQIPMGGTYLGCEKYLIYDEIDEMANPKGNFRGIDYVTVYNSVVNKSYKEKAYRTMANSVDRHTYVVYFCETNGQENLVIGD